MATDQRSLPAYFNSNADFQAWCQGIAAQLVAAGMVKTADTGQINNTTVAKPAGTNAVAGYEIYRFNDTGATNGQTSNPIYLKIEYGTSGVATNPSLWLTVGTGSDGAGTITGPTLVRLQMGSQTTYTAGQTLPSYCCGDSGRLVMMSNLDTANQNSATLFFGIDRIRDASGVATGEGFTRYVFNNTNNAAVHSAIGGVAQAGNSGQSGGMFTVPSGGSISVSGGGLRVYNNNLLVMPMIVPVGQLRFLSTGVLYYTADLGTVPASTFIATNFGASHTYMTIPSGASFGGTNVPAAMLWE